MLVDFSIQNYTSFNNSQELSMVASTSTKEEESDLSNSHRVDSFGIKEILKSAAIFGANGSGKTNIVSALYALRDVVLRSLDSSVGDSRITEIVPFLLKDNYFDIPSEFEISFIADERLYRYGLAIENGEISEEWLYRTKARETMLFHRRKQTIEYNSRSFSEAKLFTKKKKGSVVIEKTKPSVPFLSVLSQFNGEISSIITSWFKRVNIISGLHEDGFKQFTINLLDENPEFKLWALEILRSIQIDDFNVVEYEKEFTKSKSKKAIDDEDLRDVMTKLEGFLEKNKVIEKRIEIVKRNSSGKTFSVPISIESEGTQKLIYLLGPLYDVIKNNEILVVDEFDNKFHTLLCKFIISLYNDKNFGQSQLVLTCHDTNLLTKELFRRDQIWFVEKNESHESELYSLVEYKEHYTRKEDSYSSDYLMGKYGAIPLFSSLSELGDMLNG